MNQNIGVEITSEDDVAVVAFKAATISDVKAIADISEQINDFVDQDRPKAMVFDFTGVKFFSSQVLGMLLGVRAKLEAYDGRIAVSAIDPQLHRIFKITNLNSIFVFYPGRQSAVRAMSKY